ncbi:MAG: dockerin type I repeat-containing protein [candidate division Zixibacteria bacterium]|nr:dockerin type I repeat-containing protein [candidate division Zixibacteria bacterium]
MKANIFRKGMVIGAIILFVVVIAVVAQNGYTETFNVTTYSEGILPNGDFERDTTGTEKDDISEWNYDIVVHQGNPPTGDDLQIVDDYYFKGVKSVYSYLQTTSVPKLGGDSRVTQYLSTEEPVSTTANYISLWVGGDGYTTSSRYHWYIGLCLTDGTNTHSEQLRCDCWGNNEGCTPNHFDYYDATETGADGRTWKRYTRSIPDNIDKSNLTIKIEHYQSSWDYTSASSWYRLDYIYFSDSLGNPLTPSIISASDVGNDQGRQVRVKWERCYYDVEGSDTTITEYSLWRRIDEDKSNAQGDEMWLSDVEMLGMGRIYPPGDWDFIKTVPARGESTYNTVCPTLGDSTEAEGMYWSVFFVSAMTADPLVYFDSDPDSGYSLDNIPPLPIQDLEIDPSSWFTLEWTVPGEYVGEQPISSYDIRYSPVPVGPDTQAWWDSAEVCTGDGFFNFTVGEEDSYQVAKETWCHPEVYFAIKGLDSRPNASGISNIVHFLCGDATSDGVIDIGDVVKLINYLYKGGDPPEPMAAGDCTCDGVVELGDVVHLINYLFKNGDPPCSSQ